MRTGDWRARALWCAGTLAIVGALSVAEATGALAFTDAPIPPQPTLGPGLHQLQTQLPDGAGSWLAVVPPGDRASDSRRLVVVLHGAGGTGADMRRVGLEAFAALKNVVVAYPDAAWGTWNDGRPGSSSGAPSGTFRDDVAFLDEVITETSRLTDVRDRRAGVIGFSNGAVMSTRLACELSHRVSVIGVVGGSAPEGFQNSCFPEHPVSVVVVGGSADPVVPMAGGRVADWRGLPRGRVAPVGDLVSFWAHVDDCGDLFEGVVSDRPLVTRLASGRCDRVSDVSRLQVEGGTHEWLRSPGFDTTSHVWEFVVEHLGGRRTLAAERAATCELAVNGRCALFE